MTALERVVALDPGLKPGVVELDGTTGQVIRVASSLRAAAPWLWVTEWDMAATELQWYFGKGRRKPGQHGRPGNTVDVNCILSLAFRAGFGLACIPAARSLALKPQDWRAALGFGAGLTKEQVQKKIAKDLTAPERVLFQGIPPARHGDALDAIGIGRAAILLAPTTTTHDWNVYK